MMNNNIDWETREDVETLKRYKAIENDEERLAKAQNVIKEEIIRGQQALGIKSKEPAPKKEVAVSRVKNNPATIGRLHFPTV